MVLCGPHIEGLLMHLRQPGRNVMFNVINTGYAYYAGNPKATERMMGQAR